MRPYRVESPFEALGNTRAWAVERLLDEIDGQGYSLMGKIYVEAIEPEEIGKSTFKASAIGFKDDYLPGDANR